MLSFEKSFLFCSFVCVLPIYSLKFEDYTRLNKVFREKLQKRQINESNVHLVLFDNHLILIGVIEYYSNLGKVLSVANQMSSTINRSKKTCNLLVYDLCYSENERIKKLVKSFFRKSGYILLNNYMIFTMSKVVWVIGYARTCYEKEMVRFILSSLKSSQKIKNFYYFIRYKKNSNSKGFIYRHII